MLVIYVFPVIHKSKHNTLVMTVTTIKPHLEMPKEGKGFKTRTCLFSCPFIVKGFPSAPVPQKVSQLEMQALQGWQNALRVTWAPPAGEWERYRILLLNNSVAIVNSTVDKNTRQYEIRNLGLIPGRLYQAAVIVESGDLKSIAKCEGRTGTRQYIRHVLYF